MVQRSSIHMTDNAMLRWLERAGLVDVEALRQEIEARLARSHAAALMIGADRYTIIAHGLVYAVKSSNVTTVLSDRGSGTRGHNAHFQSANPIPGAPANPADPTAD